MTAPSGAREGSVWASPYGADPAAYGLAPVESVIYCGRRFVVAPPASGAIAWAWAERGDETVFTAPSRAIAYLSIGAYVALTRKEVP